MLLGNITKAVTYDGKFSDKQVFTAALINIISPDIEITRQHRDGYERSDDRTILFCMDDNDDSIDLLDIWQDFVSATNNKYHPFIINHYTPSIIDPINNESCATTMELFNVMNHPNNPYIASQSRRFETAVEIASRLLRFVATDMHNKTLELEEVFDELQIAIESQTKYIMLGHTPSWAVNEWLSINSSVDDVVAMIYPAKSSGYYLEAINDRPFGSPVPRFIFPENMINTIDYINTAYPTERLFHCSEKGDSAKFCSYDGAMSFAARHLL